MVKKNLKKVVSLALASVMASSLAACKGNSGSGTTTATQVENKETGSKEAENGSEDVTIKFCQQSGDSRHEATKKVVNTSVAKYPDTKVECKYGARTGWEEKQSLTIQGRDAADVIQINWSWIASCGGSGTNFANLKGYGDVPDLTQLPQDSLDRYEAGGELMAVSVALARHLFYWDKTTFDETKCEIPTDEASLLGAGAKFKVYNEDYYPLVVTEYGRAIFLVYYLESVYGKPQVENGGFQYTAEGIQTDTGFMIKLGKAHVTPTIIILWDDITDSLNKNAKVIDGKYAGVFEWGSAASRVQKTIAESTTKPGQELIIGNFLEFGDYDSDFTKIFMALAISADSTYPKGAAMLTSYLLNGDEAIETYGTECGILCSAEDVKILGEKGIGNKLVVKTNARVLAHSKFPLDPMFERNDLKVNPDDIYYKVFGKLSAGDITSAQATGGLMRGIDDRYNF